MLIVNAKELRIGNLVDYPLIGIRPIETGEDIDGAYAAAAMPILLTPKWLGRFGFQASNGIEMQNDLWLIVHVHEDRANLYDIKTTKTVQLNMPCRYVHQLQNLYFALSGEELTIKEPA